MVFNVRSVFSSIRNACRNFEGADGAEEELGLRGVDAIQMHLMPLEIAV